MDAGPGLARFGVRAGGQVPRCRPLQRGATRAELRLTATRACSARMAGQVGTDRHARGNVRAKKNSASARAGAGRLHGAQLVALLEPIDDLEVMRVTRGSASECVRVIEGARGTSAGGTEGEAEECKLRTDGWTEGRTEVRMEGSRGRKRDQGCERGSERARARDSRAWGSKTMRVRWRQHETEDTCW